MPPPLPFIPGLSQLFAPSSTHEAPQQPQLLSSVAPLPRVPSNDSGRQPDNESATSSNNRAINPVIKPKIHALPPAQGLSAPQHTNGSVKTQQTLHNRPSLNQEPLTAGVVASAVQNGHNPVASDTDKEEGELSDTSVGPTSPQPAKSLNPPVAYRTSPEMTNGVSGSAAALQPRPEYTQTERPGKSAYKRKRVERADRIRQNQLLSRTKMGGSPLLESGSTPVPDSVRERTNAKEFILAWTRNGYTFQQLVAEGINPRFLEQLYYELKIDSGESALRNDADVVLVHPTKNHVQQEHTLFRDDPPLPQSTVQKKVLAPDLPPADRLVRMTAVPDKHIEQQTSSIEVPKPTPLNRKDYIARLLAAKNKRPAAQNESVLSTSTTIAAQPFTEGLSFPTDSRPDNKEASSDIRVHPPLPSVPAPESIPKERQSSSANPQNPASGMDEAILIAKKKAQTELARLRLQALASAKATSEAKSLANVGVAMSAMDVNQREPVDRPISIKPEAVVVTNGQETLPASSEEGEIAEVSGVTDEVPILAQPATTQLLTSKAPQSSSAIPGMAGNPTLADAITNDMLSAINEDVSAAGLESKLLSQTRKRPVASDFDGDPPAKTLKRPFGNAPGDDYEDVVIQASDEDLTEDEEAGRVNLATIASQLSRAQPGVSISSLSSEISQMESASEQEAERLKRKQEQIELMKKKIAEMELKRRAKAIASRSMTPVTPSVVEQSSFLAAPVASGVAPYITAEPVRAEDASHAGPVWVATDDNPQSSLPSASKQADAQGSADTQSTASMLPKNITKEMNQVTKAKATKSQSPQHNIANNRREEIQSRLTLADASFSSSQTRLALLRAQMEEVEKEMRKEQEEKERLVSELEVLGIDTEGMPHSELQAVKADHDARVQAEMDPRVPSVDMLDMQATGTDNDRTSIATESFFTPQPLAGRGAFLDKTAQQLDTTAVTNDDMIEDEAMSIDESSDDPSTRFIHIAQQDEAIAREYERKTPSTEMSALPEQPTDVDGIDVLANKVGSESGEIASSTSSAPSSSAPAQTSLSDDGPYLSASEPRPIVEPESNGTHRDWGSLLFIANLPFDATEDDVRGLFDAFHIDEVSLPINPRTGRFSGYGFVNLRTSEEALQAVRDVHGQQLKGRIVKVQLSKTPAPTKSVKAAFTREVQLVDPESNDNMQLDGAAEAIRNDDSALHADILLANDKVSDVDSESESEYEPEDIAPAAIACDPATVSTTSSPETREHIAERSHALADDLASKLQPSQAEESLANVKTSVSTEAIKSHFTPYVSALSNFKAYRYHQNYLNEVKGGIRSVTYSHSIDPLTPWCPFESAGGICNDPKCEGQHFRQMVVGDDEILKQIGTTNPGRTDEEKKQYTQGLRGVVSDLRARSVKDSMAVASAIFDYRRSFLNDPSRVLNL